MLTIANKGGGRGEGGCRSENLSTKGFCVKTNVDRDFLLKRAIYLDFTIHDKQSYITCKLDQSGTMMTEEGGGGVSEMLTMADGGGVQEHLILADVICEHPL